MPFGENFSAGIQLDYLTTKIGEGYGNNGVVAGEFGLQAKPLKNLTIGAHIFNPSRAKIISSGFSLRQWWIFISINEFGRSLLQPLANI